MNTLTRRIGATTVAALMMTGVVATTPAFAKNGNDGRVIATGDCSRRTDWKLKAKPDDGRMEVEFEVDSNRNGQRWSWTIRHDGVVKKSGRRTTHAPSGSFEVRRLLTDAPGKHTFTATARNLRTGEVCRALVRA